MENFKKKKKKKKERKENHTTLHNIHTYQPINKKYVVFVK